MSTQTSINRAADNHTDGAYTALLLDYAAGAVTPSQALVVRTHVALRPEAMDVIAVGEVAGGALLEAIEPEPMAAFCLSRGRSKARRGFRRQRDTSTDRINLALNAPDALHWGWLAPGIRRHRLPADGASLLRVAPGREAPRHDHDGQELTLVLRGELVDEGHVHRAGDIVIAGPGDAHAPHAGGAQECICLISMSGAWRLSDWTQRFAARLFAS